MVQSQQLESQIIPGSQQYTDKMDEEELVIDSPELSPCDEEDLEDIEDHQLGQPAANSSMLPKAGNTHFHKDKDGDRKQVGNCLLKNC